jgi:bifunctional non-homologous end joining protein LigD
MNSIQEQTVSITLYYREGSSDKVYQCTIEPSGDLFVVNFAYGRRGTTLQTGTKTSSPVDYDTAKNIYDKLVREKTAKGYTPGADGAPYQHTDKEQKATGILPQLLNAVDDAEVSRLIKDPAWCMQEKKDGRRILLQKQKGEAHGINRRGLLVGLPSGLVFQAGMMGADFILDGEIVGLVLFAFDLLRLGGESLLQHPYRTRLDRLEKLLTDRRLSQIVRVDTAFTVTQKSILLDRLKEERKEGVVFKRLDAPYTPGRPNSGGSQLKHKFCATLSAVVAKLNPQRSVEIRLLNGQGWVPAGNVTIPPNHAAPKVGAVVEVRYLYALRESGCLYQPVYLGPRQDVPQHECVASQLKFKSDEEDPR